MSRKPAVATLTLDPITVRKDDVERLTGLSRSTIERLMKSGRLKFAKIGRSVLFDYAAVLALRPI